MTLAFFKYGLPFLLGYTLFVGVTGRLHPFFKPPRPQERATKLLGLWIGLTVFCVFALSLHLAYSGPINTSIELIQISTQLLAVLILPAVVLHTWYQRRSKSLAREQLRDNTKTLLLADANAFIMSSVPTKAHTEPLNEPGHERTDSELKNKLVAETALRIEAERELADVRRTLAELEKTAPQKTEDKPDDTLRLEETLAKTIEQAAALEARANRSDELRREAELANITLKEKMLEAKQDVRRSAAARAKALGTANKTIAFARQSVEIRARLEKELEGTKKTIENRQKTISSLIRALENERDKTQSEVNALAKQRIVQEKQRAGRISLDGAARDIEKKLSSRFVKKVAKARAQTANPGHSESR